MQILENVHITFMSNIRNSSINTILVFKEIKFRFYITLDYSLAAALQELKRLKACSNIPGADKAILKI